MYLVKALGIGLMTELHLNLTKLIKGGTNQLNRPVIYRGKGCVMSQDRNCDGGNHNNINNRHNGKYS